MDPYHCDALCQAENLVVCVIECRHIVWRPPTELRFMHLQKQHDRLALAKVPPAPTALLPWLSRQIIELLFPDSDVQDDDLGREVSEILPPLSEAIRLCDTYLVHGAYLPTTLQRTELLDEVMEAVYPRSKPSGATLCVPGPPFDQLFLPALQDFFIEAPPRDFHHAGALYRAILASPDIVELSLGIISRESLCHLLGRCTNIDAIVLSVMAVSIQWNTIVEADPALAVQMFKRPSMVYVERGAHSSLEQPESRIYYDDPTNRKTTELVRASVATTFLHTFQ
ncbi:hypothetical protein FB451DRAFT_1403774 [Mycena latifolia]|nr:hypothetical protein FB451DRAFT_1403774 [Mycena latifolia]